MTDGKLHLFSENVTEIVFIADPKPGSEGLLDATHCPDYSLESDLATEKPACECCDERNARPINRGGRLRREAPVVIWVR